MQDNQRKQFIEKLREAKSKILNEKSSIVAQVPGAADYIDEAVEILNNFINDFSDRPRVCVVGSTGKGKSSLINHIFDYPLAKVNAIESETKISTVYSYPQNDPYLDIVDTRGLNEVFRAEETEKQLLDDLTAHRPHLILFVTDATNRAGVDRELDFLKRLLNECRNLFKRDVGCVVLANRADGITPSGFSALPESPWQKKSEDESAKTSAKRKNLKEKLDWFEHQLDNAGFTVRPVILPTALRWSPEKSFWNKTEVMQEVFEKSSPALLLAFGQTEQLKGQIDESLEILCEELVIRFSMISATVCWNPIPVSDAFILCPMQIAMLDLLRIIGNKGSLGSWEIFKFVGLNSQAAKAVANWMLKFAPGLGQLANSSVAALTTYGIGKIGIAHFVKGWGKEKLEGLKNFSQFKTNVEELLKKYKKQNQ